MLVNIEKWNKIVKKLMWNVQKTSELSLFNGCCADILLLFEMYRCTRDAEIKNLLDSKIDWLNKEMDGCQTFNLYEGFAGILFIYAYLLNNGRNITELDDHFFPQFDTTFQDYIDTLYFTNNYDLLFGLIGIGIYYIEISKLYPDKRKYVYYIIKNILQLVQGRNDSAIYWTYTLEKVEETGEIVNLGLLHGMPSIISFFVICIQENYGSAELYRILRQAYEALFAFKTDHPAYSYAHYCRFRNGEMHPNPVSTELFYCYGDLGVAHSVLIGKDIYGKQAFWQQNMKALLNKIERRLSPDYRFESCCFCHGWAYLLYFYRKNRVFFSKPMTEDDLFRIEQKCYKAVLYHELGPGILSGYHGVILSLLPLKKGNAFERLLLLS